MMSPMKDQPQAEALVHHVMAQLTREAVTSARRQRERHEERDRATHRGSRIALGILLPVFVALTALNVATSAVPTALGRDDTGGDDAARQAALSFAVGEVELYRDDNGKVPPDLSMLDIPEPGEWRYERRSDTDYEIELTDGAVTIGFDSAIHSDTLEEGATP
jgi:hypothetical protein